MTNIPLVPVYEQPPPQKTDPANFAARADYKVARDVTVVNGMNVSIGGMNVAIPQMNTWHSETQSARDAAVAAANFKGEWSSLSGALNIPASAAHGGRIWVLLYNVANVALEEPGVSAAWQEIGAIDPGFGRLLRITRYSVAGSGTWTRPADTRVVTIRCVGGGGGAAGGQAPAPHPNPCGGGGGGYCERTFVLAAASYNYVIGAGGAGGAMNGSVGSAGGNTTIDGMVAGGGGGGGLQFSRGGGGTASGGDLNLPGGHAERTSENTDIRYNSAGGDSRFAHSPASGPGILGTGATGNWWTAGPSGGPGFIEIWEYS